MKRPEKIKLAVWLLGLAGLAFFIALLVREGIADVFSVFAAAGWGVAAATAFHVVPLALDAAGWRALFPPARRPPLPGLFWMRWIGESVNNLVPAAQVGGDVVRTRLAGIFKRIPMPAVAASVIVNITLNVFAQIVFTLGGFALLIAMTGQVDLVKPAFAGAAISFAAVGGFYAVQRLGGIRWIAGMISHVAGAEWQSLAQDAGGLDAEVKSIYARVRDIAACFAWALVSWVAGAGEIWIALHALGSAAGFAEALVFESVSQGFRTAMFFIPGALGVQEGGYVFVAHLLGIPGEMGMALAMIRRVRELAAGIPAIIAWQFIEGNLLRRRALEGGEITPPPVRPPALEPVRVPGLVAAPSRARNTTTPR